MKKTTYPLFMLLTLSLSLPAQQTVGLFFNDSLAYNGYTLFAPMSSKVTYLIDNCGREVNSWVSEYNPGIAAYLMNDGRLLRAARIPSNFNGGGSGGGLEIYDWNGTMTWSYNYSSPLHHQHHDLEPLPNGNFLLVAWELKTQEEAIAQGRDPAILSNAGIWPEQILELQPTTDGEANIVWKWNLWDHLVQDFDPAKPNFGVVTDHPELVNLNIDAPGPGSNADWIHANSLAYNPELDQIMLGSRTFNEFWVIDHSTTTEEAASHTGGNSGNGGDLLYRWGNPQLYGHGTAAGQQLFGQHDAHWIPPGHPGEGSIIVFNNGLGRPEGDFSTVDVLTPPVDAAGLYPLLPGEAYSPENLSWSFTADPSGSMFSANISGAQRQPNGNTLICVGNQGLFFEVDNEGNMLWKYVHPISPAGPVAQGTTFNQNSVFKVRRYGSDFAGFAGKDLTPGEPLELNPLPSDCVIYDGLVATEEPAHTIPGVRLRTNPVTEQLLLENSGTAELQVVISSLTGQPLYAATIHAATLEVTVDAWPPGLYILRAFDRQHDGVFVTKFVKL
jgi:Arylsulfotransferase (ASST)